MAKTPSPEGSEGVRIQTLANDCMTPLENFYVILTGVDSLGRESGTAATLRLGAILTDAGRCLDALARLHETLAGLGRAVTSVTVRLDDTDFSGTALPPDVLNDLRDLERTVHAFGYAVADLSASLSGLAA